MKQIYRAGIILFCWLSAVLSAFAQSTPPPAIPRQDTSGLAERIYSLHDYIIREGKTVSQLSPEAMAALPVGIARDIGGLSYMISIDTMVFTPQGAFFNAYLTLEIPATGDRLAFAALNIPFQPGGLAAITASTRLALVQDYQIPISNQVTLTLPRAGFRNFIEWDCNGFKSINLKGVFEFSRELIVPEDANGNPGPGKVKASFETNMPDWGAMLVNVNITPFQLPNLRGVSFSVQDAYVDYSDLTNPSGIVFPADYRTSLGGDPALWNGFFLRRLSIKLPKKLHTKDGKRKEITATNFIVDNRGISGLVGASNLVSYKDGNLSGWPFSIDAFEIGFQCNTLSSAKFSGLLNVPLFSDKKPLPYSALITNENDSTNFLFAVKTVDSLEMSLLSARVNLLPASVITVRTVAGKLKPEAILHGTLSVGADMEGGGGKANLKGIRFENMHVTSEKPYIRSGVWSLTGVEGLSLANFPVALKSISFAFANDRATLSVGMAIHLMNSADKGFPAAATVDISGKLAEVPAEGGDEATKRQKWEFERISLSAIEIDTKGNGYSLRGFVKLYREDAVYGNGFLGKLQANFEPGVAVEVTAQFGNVKNLRYWYADGRVVTPSPVPIAPGFGLYGFGGGVYYHMKQKEDPRLQGDSTALVSYNPQPGASPSGVQYVPDSTTNLGFKAAVTVGTTPPDAFNADATFEMAFNSSGGIRFISFKGDGYFMTPIGRRSTNAPLFAKLNMSYDNVNKELNATLDTYINVSGALRGIHPGGLAGSAVLHFSRDKWFIYIGTPSQRLGVNFVNVFKGQAYFMIGTELPGMPPPPSAVTNILGNMDLDFMRDENALSNAGGFAFGASLEVGSPERKQFLMFYGIFHGGAGFDIMLKKYAGARCSGSSEPIGIGGWYASGQAYAYLQAQIGIFVNLKFVKGEFEILKLGAAAVMQAKLPNPTWVQGVVGGQFSVLGGLVKGNCRFKVTFGEQCQFEGASAVTGTKVIAELTPAASGQGVSVFNAPQVAFAVEVDKPFESLDDSGNYKAYRVRLDHFKVLSGGAEIPGTVEWNNKKDVALFKPTDIMPPNTSLQVSVQIHWEQQVNGVWQPLAAGGQVERETESHTFTTGAAPDHIDDNNVRYSYPVRNQYHFLKGEAPGGYLQLGQGQDYLFVTQIGDITWKFVARFTASGRQPLEVPLSYEATQNTVLYAIPSQLAHEQIYTLAFVKVPVEKTLQVDKNVTANDKVLVSSTDGTTVTVASKDIQGLVERPEEKLLYSTDFRTSRFSTFAEKMNALQVVASWGDNMEGMNILRLGLTLQGPEPFDVFEIKGATGMMPLLQLEADAGNTWLKDYIVPLLYSTYPINNQLTIDWRDDKLGYPPLKAVFIQQSPDNKKLEENESATGFAAPLSAYASFQYDLSYYTYRDYTELLTKATPLYLNSNGYQQAPTAVKQLFSTSYAEIMPGTYQMKLQYVLPGTNQVSNQKAYTFSW